MTARRPIGRQGASPAALFFGAARRTIGAAWLAARAAARRLRPGRPYNVLRLEITGQLAETSDGTWWGGLRTHPGVDLLTLLAALRSARDDGELGLVLLDVHDVAAGWARIQTVRRALGALRAAGKRVWAYLPQPGMHEYYLASAADRVLLAPGARFDAAGLATEVIFVKGALDKLGIEAQLARAGRFKSAAEPVTRTEMSPEHRAMVDALLDDLYAQLVGDVARARGLDASVVRRALEEGPLLAADAHARGLVDALAYPDEVDEQLAERFGDPAPIDLARYRRRRAVAARRAALRATRVGVLAVSGPIGLGSGRAGMARSAAWRTFRRELGAMAGDPGLAAIVLRIDSPGGSGLASDLMWREIVMARRLKPVVVSMGDVAASGGYFLAAGADDVTAEPGTLTGSIGVISAKPVLHDFYERLGIRKELVTRGNAAVDSDWVRLDEPALAHLRAEADAFYDDFVAKVASGRGLSPAAVEAAAEGRVWTGQQALAHGLVDRLGGLEQALDEVRRRLALAPDTRFALDRRPRRRSLWQMALDWQHPSETLAASLATIAGPLRLLAPLLDGERLLAVAPIVLRFARRGQDGAGDGLEATGTFVEPAAVAGLPRLAVRMMALAATLRRAWTAPGEPPLVL